MRLAHDCQRSFNSHAVSTLVSHINLTIKPPARQTTSRQSVKIAVAVANFYAAAAKTDPLARKKKTPYKPNATVKCY